MSTRGLLSIRFNGQDYVTYNHSDSYPKALGAWVVHFAHEHLRDPEAMAAFGRKVARLRWTQGARGGRSFRPQGRELLDAIAAGRISQVTRDTTLFQTCLDCEFAYILDLDAGTLEFWDLPDRVESFPLAHISSCAVEVMECGRRR